jgi:thiosulfate/3-mercaptopyruvate sulfurtransferase
MSLPVLLDVHDAARRIAGGARAIDCRFDVVGPGAQSARGERDHAQSHLPGAVYAHLDRDLADLSRTGEGRHPLPSAAAFAATLGRWGLRPDDAVICYDDGNGAIAARLWWLLRLAGHPAVAVLDGGFAAWRDAGLPLESGVPAFAPTTYPVRFDAAPVADAALAARAGADPSQLLLDARAAARFRGEAEPIDPVAGHVPGARNRPFADNLLGDGRFKPAEVLRAEFSALLGARTPADTVLMCGSGVTACHHLLAMAHAGLPGARVYAGSWSGWIADPARPVARGD